MDNSTIIFNNQIVKNIKRTFVGYKVGYIEDGDNISYIIFDDFMISHGIFHFEDKDLSVNTIKSNIRDSIETNYIETFDLDNFSFFILIIHLAIWWLPSLIFGLIIAFIADVNIWSAIISVYIVKILMYLFDRFVERNFLIKKLDGECTYIATYIKDIMEQTSKKEKTLQ